ncbi:MAG: molecular chaperone TorD family protein [Chloroflexota bacterium]|nr:molecular chaperone TorD family protein [Chloroflexota bacterium]
MHSLEKLGARSEVYKFLSCAYYPPQDELLKGDLPGPAKSAFDSLEQGLLAGEMARVESYLQSLRGPLELAIEHTRLFRGPVRAEAYPYESMYVDGEVLGPSAMDVARRYREAGVDVSGDFKDLPDHVCAELEFMHYLCAREFEALQRADWEEAARWQLRGDSFLKDHLSRWIPQFADSVLQHATTPFYLSLARITREFISQEVPTGCLETPP